MRRVAAYISVLACAVAVPSVALAADSPAAGPSAGAVTGTIAVVGDTTLTVQTGGRLVGVINALTEAADALSARDYPYVWGGGHAEAGMASVGIRGGPGYNGRRIGFDCSGSVAAVLSAAGLWPAGAAVPNDAGVIAELRHAGLITRGPATAPDDVMLYDDPGVHIFMSIDGRFFGTSDGGGGDPQGEPTWLDDGAPDASDRAFKRYHFLPVVLHDRTTYGHDYTFQTGADPALAAGAQLGERVQVDYAQTTTGSLLATSVSYLGAVTVSGTVTAVAPGDASLTLATSTGQSLTFATAGDTGLLAGVALGDGVTVTYTTAAGGIFIPHAVQVTSVTGTAPPTATTPTTPTVPVTTTAPVVSTTTARPQLPRILLRSHRPPPAADLQLALRDGAPHAAPEGK